MSLIDLEQAKEVVRDSCRKIPTMAIVTMQNLEKLPTTNIIHCSECRHADWQSPGNGLAYCYCMAHSRGGLKPDDYCSYGEKGESDEAD